MNAPSQLPPERLKHELAAIKSYLIAAEDVMKLGHMPDLTGLESRIAILCESVQNADNDLQKECLPELLALVDHLNVCERYIKKAQESVKT
jgi:hypothetical protein